MGEPDPELGISPKSAADKHLHLVEGILAGVGAAAAIRQHSEKAQRRRVVYDDPYEIVRTEDSPVFKPTQRILSPEYFKELALFHLGTEDLPKIQLTSQSTLSKSLGLARSLYGETEGISKLAAKHFESSLGFPLALRKAVALNIAHLQVEIQHEMAQTAELETTDEAQIGRIRKLLKLLCMYQST